MTVWIISALAFLLLLSFLVLIHELGHFLAARKAGVVVEEFGFGLPPRAKTLFQQGGTRFSLNWVPFGGFVRLRGENAVTRAERERPGSFSRVGFFAKTAILTAGVFMNFAFALILFTLGFSFWNWVPTYLSLDQIREADVRGEVTLEAGVLIAGVLPEGTAAGALVKPNSILVSVDGVEVFTPADVVSAQQGKARVRYALRETLDGEVRTMELPTHDGKTGVELQLSPQLLSAPRSIVSGLRLAFRETGVMTIQTVKGLSELMRSVVTKATVPEGVSGIVGIAVMTHESVTLGWMHYLRLVAVLSLSLAILNILPFPALDGGRLAFVIYELLARRPAPRKFELIVNSVGFFVLIGLILVVTYHDIAALF